MYSYDPLLNTNYIRVADVHPGNLGDEILVTLRPEPFATAAVPSPVVPQYEALSYTWGSEEDPSFIEIYNSSGICGKLSITRNLDVALQHLRYPNRTRAMWIDAICIDQSNDIEKGPQVAMMGSLYSLAERVVVWLGEEENDSTMAVALMQDIGAQVKVDFDTCIMEPTPNARDVTLASDNVRLPLEERELCALYHLLCRPWFERLWIRQEICLANESAIIVCGSSSMLWNVFRRAWSCFCVKPKKPFRSIDELTDRNNALSGFLYQDVGRQLPELRQSFGHAKCGNPRDRIYALLSLDKTMEDLQIIPDYTIAPAQLYEDVARRCMNHFSNLEILAECEVALAGSHADCMGPSWVPDWSVGNPYVLHLSAGVVYASGPLVGPQFPIVDGRLKVVAVSIDVIKSVQPSSVKSVARSSDSAHVQLGIKHLFSGKDVAARYPGGKEMGVLEAYVHALTLDQFAETYDPPTEAFPPFADSIELVRRLAAQPAESIPLEDENRFFDRAEDALSGRLIIETANNYIGLAPPSALTGDEIVVILGCSLPLVVRPIGGGGSGDGDGPEQWKLIGACYVCGFNKGEAILGHLPPDTRFVQVLDEDSGVYVGSFVNTMTGEVSEVDPRLGGWPMEGLQRVTPGVLGSQDRILVDGATLSSRGIPVKYLELV